MNLYATFDRSEFPVISIHFTGEKETKENFELYLQELGNNYERKEKFALVFELTNAPLPNVKYQLKQAAWMKENEPLIKKYCYGVAYVIPGMVMRSVLKFIFSVQQNPVRFEVFSTFEEGEAWAKSLIPA
ncbi:MAG: STAS/SEC14 domain-containing protein [Spirosomaceae bacterium]|nr:STAS/SEC14 domain-containing protein [Spirosomataceae bacterium]